MEKATGPTDEVRSLQPAFLTRPLRLRQKVFVFVNKEFLPCSRRVSVSMTLFGRKHALKGKIRRRCHAPR